MRPKSARAKSPGPKPKNPAVPAKHGKDGKSEYILPGRHTDDGKPMVPTSSEFLDDEWLFWTSLAVSLLIVARRCWTWDVWVWTGLVLTVVMQVFLVFSLKENNPCVLKTYICASCTLLVAVFGDCVVDRLGTCVMETVHPMHFVEVMGWWCSTKDAVQCILRTYTTVSYASLFVAWTGIWLHLPRFCAYVCAQVCV